ncbi:MAG TPA: family 16 glycoside hydrolase [Burkholderiales bacterium]
MKETCMAVATIFATSAAFAETLNFDADPPGSLPATWQQGVTGKGHPHWAVKADAAAPSKPNVLQQSGSGTFPWCVVRGTSVENGFVEVRFKAIAGKEDQAGGVVWRWKDGDNYYVARANALENNVSLYHTTNGRRNTIQYVDAPVPPNAWHTLRVEFSGSRIKVVLNGRTYIELEDAHLKGAGAVGLWTKADSVTAFDDFSYGRQ